jgi:hypothetical protein
VVWRLNRCRVAQTCFEDAGGIVGGYVPFTTDCCHNIRSKPLKVKTLTLTDVVNVFAEPGSIRSIFTCSETELVVADEQLIEKQR